MKKKFIYLCIAISAFFVTGILFLLNNNVYASENYYDSETVIGQTINYLDESISLDGFSYNTNEVALKPKIFDFTKYDIPIERKNVVSSWKVDSSCAVGIDSLKMNLNSFFNYNISTGEQFDNDILAFKILNKYNVLNNLSYSEMHNSVFFQTYAKFYDSEHTLINFSSSDYSNYLFSGIMEELYKLNSSNPTEYQIEEFFEKYGTHVIVDASYGAFYEAFLLYKSSSKANASELEIKNTLKSGLELIASGGVANSNFQSKFGSYFNKNYNASSTFGEFNVRGAGNVPISSSTFSSYQSSLKKWYDSIYSENGNFNNPKYIGVKKTVPIWNYFPQEFSDLANIFKKTYGSLKSKKEKFPYKYKEYSISDSVYSNGEIAYLSRELISNNTKISDYNNFKIIAETIVGRWNSYGDVLLELSYTFTPSPYYKQTYQASERDYAKSDKNYIISISGSTYYWTMAPVSFGLRISVPDNEKYSVKNTKFYIIIY